MARTRRQVQKQLQASRPSPIPDEFIAMIGDRNGVYRAGGNNIYVRELASGQVVVVKNLVVPSVPGRLVKVQRQAGVLHVTAYWGIYGEGDNQETIVPPHDHRFPDPNFTPIESAQMMPFNIWPYDGFTVQIFGGVFTKLDGSQGTIANQTFDLTSYQPAAGAVIVHFQHDDDGTVSVVEGTTVASKGILSPAYIPAATERSMHIAVRLYDGQESVRRDGLIDDFYDWRFSATNPEQLPLDAYRFGFVTDYAGTQETTIAFDDGTYTFTLSPTGTKWSYYRNGIRYTITGEKAVVLAGTPPSKGLYYIYIDSDDGELIASTTPWTLEDTKVMVASIVWDDTLDPKYWLADERHTCAIDRRYHWEHHFSDGTEIIEFPELSGYTVQPAVPANTDNTFGISEAITSDEDLKHTLDALADGNGVDDNYVIDFRVAADEWDWEYSPVPFRYTAAGYIQYDNAGTMTQGANNKFYNYFLLATNREGDARFTLIPGQAQYDTLAEAKEGMFGELTLTGIAVAEFVAIYQLIFRTSAAYSSLGKCRLANEPIVIEVSASGAGATASFGDMRKDVYDTDDDGMVDNAENTLAIDGVPVDMFVSPSGDGPSDGDTLVYDEYLGAFIPGVVAGSGDMTKAVYDANDDGIVDAVDGGDSTGPTTQIQIRRDTIANWASNNPTLTAGEIGIETDASPIEFKIGDGSNTWNDLDYFNDFLPLFVFDVISDTITGNQTNYHPTGIENSHGLFLNSDGAYTIGGIYPPGGGGSNQAIFIRNNSSYSITLLDQDGSTNPIYRFNFGFDLVLPPNAIIWLIYNSSRWILLTGPTGKTVKLDTTNFDNNLSSADDDVQKMAETLNDLTVAGGSSDGWMAASVQPTRTAADDPSYSLSFASVDLTGDIVEGSPCKWTQNSIVRYGFINSAPAFSTNTTATILTHCSDASGDYDVLDTGTYPITDFYYGLPGTRPLGFPLNFWTIIFSDTSRRSQASPTAGTWYNLGSLSLVKPLGQFDVVIKGSGRGYDNSGTAASCVFALSTSTSSSSDGRLEGFTALQVGSSNIIIDTYGSFGIGPFDVGLAAKTTLYPIAKTTVAAIALIEFINDITKMEIELRSRYL